MVLLIFVILVFSGIATSAQSKSCSSELISGWRSRCNMLSENIYNVSHLDVLQHVYLTGDVSSAAMEQQVSTAAFGICHWFVQSVQCEKELVQACFPDSFSSVFEMWMRLAIAGSCARATVSDLVPAFLTCNKKVDFIGNFQRELRNISQMAPPSSSPTGLEPFDDICLALQRVRSTYSDDELIFICGHPVWESTTAVLESIATGFECTNGTSQIQNAMNSVLPLPALSFTTSDPWATSGTHPTWTPWQTTPDWWQQPTTRYPSWQTTTDYDWWRPTTPAPTVEIPEYLLNPFNVTCRKGLMYLSEEDPDLVDAVSLVFDGDNTLNCRLILNDLHFWILSKMGETRQKRSFDEEPIKVTCTRGNLTVSSVDPGTSESTDLVFHTGASTRCITVYREFLNYIAYSFK